MKRMFPMLLSAGLLAGLTATPAMAQPTGACFNAPVPGQCMELTAADCLAAGGVYQGDRTACVGPYDVSNYVQFQAGQGGAPDGSQVNFSGATLFVDFFRQFGSTNDFINIDGDTINIPCGPGVVPFAGALDTDCNSIVDTTDQLAPGFAPGGPPNGGCFPWTGYVLVQYRSVGSVEGYEEFIDYQLLGTIPTAIPSERGIINRVDWAVSGVPVATCLPPADLQGDSNVNNDSRTPVIPKSIDGANLDVPGLWGTVGPGTGNDAVWNRKPGQAGYGRNPKTSSGIGGGFSNLLASLQRGPFSLNFNNNPPITPPPDGNTLYDTPIAWSPVVPIANRGTGLENVRYTEMQHLWVTGRMPSGENFEVNTRDVGSGTRNDFSNGIGVDPSHLVGDHRGPRINTEFESNTGVVIKPNVANAALPTLPIGAPTQPTNCGSSSISEAAVRSRRLCVGYTGYFGNSRAAQDAVGGQYEILNVCKDIDGDGDGFIDSDCTPQACDNAVGAPPGCALPYTGVPADWTPANNGFVRPTVSTILDSDNPRCSFQICAAQTLVTRGDPQSGIGGNTNPPMANLNARNLIRNISASIAAFTGSPAADPNFNMPGEVLSTRFVMTQATDAITFQSNPTDLRPDGSLSQILQNYTRCTNVTVTPPFGSVNVAGQIPRRNTRNPGGVGIGPGGTYGDGSANGNYFNSARSLYTAIGGQRLNRRNRIAGDFDGDFARTPADIAPMMEAIQNPTAWALAQGVSPGTGGGDGPCADDYVIPEVIGDYNSDGEFDSIDVRYYADGLTLVGGRLNRELGFTLVDTAWAGLTGNNNYFNTQLATYPPATGYKPGDSRGDVAGNPPMPGAQPNGANGIINAQDIDYVYANRGNWSDIFQAANMDLSADMNGDLFVNQLDVDIMVLSILCTRYGDADLDGDVDAADQTLVAANAAISLTPAGWADGDFNGDRIVTAADLAILTANLGFSGPACVPPSCGDIDANGAVNSIDVSLFVSVVLGTNTNQAQIDRSNLSPSLAVVNGGDIQRFVCCVLNAGSLSACP